MVALIELLLGLFLVALVLLEATGKTDLLGRRKRKEIVERYEREGPYEPDLDDDGDKGDDCEGGGDDGDDGSDKDEDDGDRDGGAGARF